MPSLSIDISVLTNLERRMYAALDKNPARLSKATRKMAQEVRKRVKANTPQGKSRHPGQLRNSYKITKKTNQTYTVGTDIMYAGFVEHGHPVVRVNYRKERKTVGKASGKYYLKRALAQSAAKYPRVLKGIIKELAQEVGLSVQG